MSTAHTPGPWQVSSIRHESDGCYTFALGKDGDVAGTNARLIAAAPEMLEALREVEQYLENDSYSETAYTVRAAIAKATGGGK